MGRNKSRRKLGARRYSDYSLETLNVAVDLVKSQALSSYEAEKQFGIPRRTILNKCKSLHGKPVGRPQELSIEEETHIAKVINIAAEFGSPLSLLELRILVYNYLEKNEKTALFNGKMPGERWARNFLQRHNFTQRATQNIKRSRATKSVEEMSNYYENLKTSLKDVPSQNILNFDETNLSDDPGSQKAIFKRGVKHPERVLNSSKSSVSVMFSVTADGDCLPPYVVYKAEHLWSRWCEYGPPKTRYNRTKSGWFDMVCFDDWFKTIVLPWADSREGVKVIIGDNLASHLSVEVIQLCGEHNIRFIFLPPNSTHMTQPLDVAFFGPMKRQWRDIMLQYKLQNQNATTINKFHFPQLLQELMTKINMTQSATIRSGFAATGIYPFDPSRVLKKIPVTSEEEKRKFDVSLLEYLQKVRKSTIQPNKKSNKKLSVVAGKSISTEEANRHTINTKTDQDIKNKLKYKKQKKVVKKSKVKIDTIPQKPQQPKSLKELCTQLVNKLWLSQKEETTSSNSKDRGTSNPDVLFLKQLPKDGPSKLPFMAENEHDLPKSLSVNETEDISTKSKKPKIKILSNVIIKAGTMNKEEGKEIIKNERKRKTENSYSKDRRTSNPDVHFLKQLPKDDPLNMPFMAVNGQDLPKCILMKDTEDSSSKSKKPKIKILSDDIIKVGTTNKEEEKKVIKNERKRKAENSSSRRKIKRLISESSISSENSFIEDALNKDNNSDYETLHDFIIDCLEQGKENFDPEPDIPFGLHEIDFLKETPKFKDSDWILTRFATKKSIKHFVGQIMSLNNEKPTVKFLRKVKNSKHEKGTTFTYPTVDDVSKINSDDIITILPEPLISRRGQVIFNVNFTDFNIQ